MRQLFPFFLDHGTNMFVNYNNLFSILSPLAVKYQGQKGLYFFLGGWGNAGD
jgi:hypothetical protein